MSILGKTVLTVGSIVGLGIATQLGTSPEPEPESNTSVAPDSVVRDVPELTLRGSWNERGRAIRQALPDGAVPVSVKNGPTSDEARDRRRGAFREQVNACMDDVGDGVTGAVTISVHEIGAPDVGTIFDSVEIVHASFEGPELLECLVQSMYSHVGDAPNVPYEYQSTWTLRLGKPTEQDAKESQVIGYIVGAHMSEARACERKWAEPVTGTLSIALTVGTQGLLTASVPETSDLPQPVVDCVVDRTMRWKFPKTVAGKTFVHEMNFPVPGR